jgi:signal peptidase I
MELEGKEKMPTQEALLTELKRERYRNRFKRVLKSTVYTLIVVAAVAVLVATLVLPVLQIAGTSMEPNLEDGDLVLLVKTKNLQRGELCAFYYSNKILIKRVIGLPGDYIYIDNEGTVYVNDEALDEPYVAKKALGECDMEFPYQVPENKYFLMGDHRETSIDSRSSVIGCVEEEQLVGKLICKFWPLNKFTWID